MVCHFGGVKWWNVITKEDFVALARGLFFSRKFSESGLFQVSRGESFTKCQEHLVINDVFSKYIEGKGFSWKFPPSKNPLNGT